MGGNEVVVIYLDTLQDFSEGKLDKKALTVTALALYLQVVCVCVCLVCMHV